MLKIEDIYLSNVSQEQWQNAISENPFPQDRFAKTFLAKCNMLQKWESVVGLYSGETLLGAELTTFSKRSPICANLQLLHIFSSYRKQGLARLLCQNSLAHALATLAVYYRVSAEPEAVHFYRNIGVKFWGMQKSGCSLSLFKINGESFSKGIYDESDPFIAKNLTFSKRKGSVTERFGLAI